MDYMSPVPGVTPPIGSSQVTDTSAVSATPKVQNAADTAGSGTATIATVGQLQALAPELYNAIQKNVYLEIKRSGNKLKAALHRIRMESK